MKKIACLLLLFQGGIMMAQTETVVTPNGKKIQVTPNGLGTADNGLTAASGNVQLGGTLKKATELVTTSSATLALKGLQAGAAADNVLVVDASGVIKSVPRASLGDNLGNHTATSTLNMAKNTINNVNVEYFADQKAENTETYGLYKNTGVFGVYSSKNKANDLSIDEATRKTTVSNLAVSKGTDGAAPAVGSIAVAADTAGNVVWKPASSLAVTGDNLGNHTATQDLNMSSKNITAANNITAAGNVAIGTTTPKGKLSVYDGQLSFDKLGDGDKIWMFGSKDQSKIATETGWNLVNHSGDLATASSGKFSWKSVDANKAWTEKMTLDNSGSLTVTNKIDAQQAKIAKGTDGAAPMAGSVAVAADTAGNVVWKPASSLAVTGDNLGSHTATQDLNMSSKNITAANNITAAGKTTTNTIAIAKGTDNAAPMAGSVAVAADANGNVVWKSASSIGAGDNLGNHTASKTLDMAKNTINNVNVEYFSDQKTDNADTYGLYKNTGVFGVYSSKNKANDLSIDEATRKTTVNNLAVSKGTDGAAPAVGSIAVAADTDGNVVWKPASSLAVTGDNLGNHTAAKALDMTGNDINNIKRVFIESEAVFEDRTTTNTNVYTFYKNNGSLNLWNSLKSSNDISVNETNRRTSINNLAIASGTDGAGPVAGSVAVAADTAGNVVWKPASSLAVTGDNLGSHTATQDLNMSSKNITAANNITAAGKTTTNTIAIAKGTDNAAPVAGSVAVAADANGNVVWKPASSLAVTGDNLGSHTATQDLNMSSKNITAANNITAAGKTTTNTIAIAKGTDNAAPMAGSVAVAADANGNVVWKSASSIGAGDDLGNHTATSTLNMAKNNINNVNVEYFADQKTDNADTYGLYKNTGVFGVYSSKNKANDLSIDESTRKTTVNNLAVTKGTDGVAPAAGSIAVASDANGNVVWKSPSLIGAGDNLGNHIATQNLEMSSKNITNISNAYIKNELQVSDRTTTNKNYFGLYKTNGSFNVWNSLKSTNDLSIDEATRKTTVNNLALSKGTDGAAPAVGSVAVAADTDGNVVWKPAASIGDNLGNHTATANLNMSSKDINNVGKIFVESEAVIKDRATATNTNTYNFYKNNGVLGVYNSLKGVNDITVNETNRRTTINNLAVTTGTDGVAPKAGYIATAADANGNVVWKENTNAVVPTEVGTVISIDGKLQVAQEITAQMAANYVRTASLGTISPIGNITNVIIDNKSKFTSSATDNSFTVDADGTYLITLNAQVVCPAVGAQNNQSIVLGIRDNTTGQWVARVNDSYNVENTYQTFTLITSIPMLASHSYSFATAGNFAHTILAFSSGSTGIGPVSFYSVKRIK